jgi:hypothetical protein
MVTSSFIASNYALSSFRISSARQATQAFSEDDEQFFGIIGIGHTTFLLHANRNIAMRTRTGFPATDERRTTKGTPGTANPIEQKTRHNYDTFDQPGGILNVRPTRRQ